jgi:hypothetical protein
MIGSSRLNLAYEGLLLGMQAEGHGDCKIEAHPRVHIQMNLCPEMKVDAHLLLCTGSSRPRDGQVEAGAYTGGRFCTRGFKAANGLRQRSFSHQRPQDDEEAMPEVYPVDDVVGWTCVTSSFVGHRDICKS